VLGLFSPLRRDLMNASEDSFVSIIVPVYNGEEAIDLCVESLLGQDYPQDRYEVIIVDNGSKDSSAEIVRRYPVKLFSETSIQSSYAARNRGIEASRGDFLAFTDSDCIASMDWLTNLLSGFVSPEVGGVAGRVKAVDQQNAVSKYEELKHHRNDKYVNGIFYMPFAATCNVMYRRSVFDQIGLFDETFISGGDVDFSWRMQIETNLKLKYQPQAVVEHFNCMTIWEYSKKPKKYAMGVVQLAKKYPQIVNRQTSLSRTSRFYLGGFMRLFNGLRQWYVGRKTSSDPQESMEGLLTFVRSLSFQIGFLLGSIKHRHWCNFPF
jgi:glycosyltransferase involved in cell wall biosynthesis